MGVKAYEYLAVALSEAFLVYGNMEIARMGQYFFCPLSNPFTLETEGGVDLHSTSIYAEDIN